MQIFRPLFYPCSLTIFGFWLNWAQVCLGLTCFIWGSKPVSIIKLNRVLSREKRISPAWLRNLQEFGKLWKKQRRLLSREGGHRLLHYGLWVCLPNGNQCLMFSQVSIGYFPGTGFRCFRLPGFIYFDDSTGYTKGSRVWGRMRRVIHRIHAVD